MSIIHVVGLGPGDLDSLPVRTHRLLRGGHPVFLRTAVHPVVEDLRREGISFSSFDPLYETADDFDQVYRAIAAALLETARGQEIVYAVPGHPLMAEQSVQYLLRDAKDVEVRIEGGQSFIDPVCTLLGIDPIEGLLLLDGTAMQVQQITPGVHLLIAQVFHPRVAGDVKLTLMEVFPDEYPVTVVRAAGVSGMERMETIPLYELDRLDWIDHLTTVFVPAGDAHLQRRDAWYPARLVERLRRPGGCPWDRKQTHESLRPYAIEEAYEVADAIDRGDPDALADELGDLYLQILLHAQIASEAGDFTLRDVFEKLSDKLIRRHPHVFGEDGGTRARSPEEAEAIWAEQKAAEAGGSSQGAAQAHSVLDEVRWGKSAFAVAKALQVKAAEVGFDWDKPEDVLEKLREEVEELADEVTAAQRDEEKLTDEFADVLFTVVNLARWLELDIEKSLSAANRKFARRFAYVESQVKASGLAWSDVDVNTLERYWNDAKISRIPER
ncbi:nucleoside triphosphate pyrophosphohydrolase [Alicyclobacillus cycloheptanicus]|uniref:Tetrapyrrole methylase family protein/MazG family protein n=1 Tax=Alicyclobacillus cycloheptanicus TaxID=1457 RepID=A0ABT9XIP0_9BACL|nr:nucleoside triphosphate pyrophosphohydrolase [Alicyclobacillus cycloheptanicus]MDQ0190153.1 tetrapyrrole methylase family protein/MazG family protein [Alicyclobacillus cycloheptanicus]WDM02592.1 nucleoside triphosphate pyrophosphohydrolase [Alicyclobacillus cycloheptanicus]